MVNPAHDEAEDKPLDPAVLRVQARLRRLMLIAGLTLGLGLLAVFAAIVYRIGGLGQKGPAAPAEAARFVEATIPAGARLLSTTAAGDRIVLTYEHPGGTILVVVDARNLAVVGRIELKPE
jgi:hypothetical protein